MLGPIQFLSRLGGEGAPSATRGKAPESMSCPAEAVTVGGKYVVVDEMHKPDSNRFWEASEYAYPFAAGTDQKMLDKENIRSPGMESRP